VLQQRATAVAAVARGHKTGGLEQNWGACPPAQS